MDVKLNQLTKAVSSLNDLAKKINNLTTEDEIILDGLQNGLAQKFEYTIELFWKTVKKYLLKYEGIDTKSPKQAIKEFYKSGNISEDQYLLLIRAIDDRNVLSHVYNENDFSRIIDSISDYTALIFEITDLLSKK